MTQRRGLPERTVTPAEAALWRGMALPRMSMSRRSMMAGSSAVGLGAFLAACGTGGTAASSDDKPSAATDISDSDKRLTWDNWALYLDYDDTSKSYPSLDTFQDKTGIAVKYQEAIEDNDTYYGKIQAQLKNGQDTGADLMVLTDWMAARVIRQGYVQKFDKANMPNVDANLDDKLKTVDFDSGRNYSVTWQSGYAGLVWSKEAFPNGLKSVDELWQASLKGKVEVLSEMRDTIGLIMLNQGVDISKEFTADQFGAALDVLKKQLDNGQIRQVKGNSYKEDLISGDMVAGIAWSGDITQLNAENGDKWGFGLPEKGATLWSDNLLIPIGAKHKKNAETLINYYYDPAVMALVEEYVQYICPIPASKPIVAKKDSALAGNPYVFPTAADLSKAHVFRTLSPAEETEFTSQFQGVLGI